MKKASLVIAYVASHDKMVNDFSIKAGEVTFAVMFEGYVSRRYFYGIRTSMVYPFDAPRYIRVKLSNCRHYMNNYSLDIDDSYNYTNHPSVKILTESEATEVEATMSTL